MLKKSGGYDFSNDLELLKQSTKKMFGSLHLEGECCFLRFGKGVQPKANQDKTHMLTEKFKFMVK